MATTNTPIFTQVGILGKAQISTANTARDGSGTLGSVRVAGANGDILDYVQIVATGTTTTGVVRLFIDDGGGAKLLDEILVTAITPSTTVKVFTATWTPPGGVPLPLPSGSTLKASTNNAETFNVFAMGGQF